MLVTFPRIFTKSNFSNSVTFIVKEEIITASNFCYRSFIHPTVTKGKFLSSKDEYLNATVIKLRFILESKESYWSLWVTRKPIARLKRTRLSEIYTEKDFSTPITGQKF